MRLHIQDAEPLARLAVQAGISLRTPYKRLSRYRSAGAAALLDRRSVRRSQRRTLDPEHLQGAVALRLERCTLKAMGLGRLKHLEPG